MKPRRGTGRPLLALLALLAHLALLAGLAGCGPAHIEPYTPRQRSYQVPTAQAPSPEDRDGSLWRADARNASLFSDYRAFREQDIVVVRVEENADARRNATTKTGRASTMEAALSAFLNAAGTAPATGTPVPSLTAPTFGAGGSATSNLGFDATGNTGRSERLTATVPAIVKKVLPNGNLFIEGHRVVLVNNEEQHFYISGLVRPIDIAQDNSVRSSFVADAEIEFTGRGVLTQNQQPGILQRLFGWIWPF